MPEWRSLNEPSGYPLCAGRANTPPSTFTKKLLPSLRLGFIVAPPEIIPSLVAAKRLSILGNAAILEAALCEFLERGYYDVHLRAVQAALDARYHACLESLRELMPDEVRFTTPGGGPTLWLEVPRRVELSVLRQRMAARGVHLEDTANQFQGAPHLWGFRLSYAFLPAERLREGLTRLAGELRALLR